MFAEFRGCFPPQGPGACISLQWNAYSTYHKLRYYQILERTWKSHPGGVCKLRSMQPFMTGLRSRYDFDGHVLLHVKTLWIVAIGYSFTSFELYGRGSPRTRFLTKIDTLGQRQWSPSKRSIYLRTYCTYLCWLGRRAERGVR